MGVEKSYEKQLRGEKGVQIMLRDAHGRIQGSYMNGSSTAGLCRAKTSL